MPHANNYLLQFWLDCVHKDKIFIGSHTLDCPQEVRQNRYTDDRTGKYDGVHMYSSAGKTAYTDSVLNILLSAFNPQQNPQEKQNHTRCPQAEHTRKQKSSYIVKVSNRFIPLNNCQGNF